MSNISRRKFIYLGTGVAATAGIGYLTKDYWLPKQKQVLTPSPTITTTPTETVNNPPYASIRLKNPLYIEPCVEQDVRFENLSGDPDGDPLFHQWYVDYKLQSEKKDFVVKFSKEGPHSISLKVSDGKLSDETGTNIDVVTDQIYPLKKLKIRYKGIRYCSGAIAPEWGSLPTPSVEVMDEQLDTIRDDLGCNAISIIGGVEDNMIECGKLAIEKGFDRIALEPSYMNRPPDKTVEHIGKFAKKVRTLREMSDNIIFHVGHEFSLETAIVTGSNWFQRLETLVSGREWSKASTVIHEMFKKIIPLCKENYGYEISYASTIQEAYFNAVPWDDPIFESVGVDAYVQEVTGNDQSWIVNLLNRMKRFGKPVYSTEWGSMTYSGASKQGGVIELDWDNLAYDEDEQARYIEKYCEMLNGINIDGSFLNNYNDNWQKSYCIWYGRKRKKGFYMYKSYERVNP